MSRAFVILNGFAQSFRHLSKRSSVGILTSDRGPSPRQDDGFVNRTVRLVPNNKFSAAANPCARPPLFLLTNSRFIVHAPSQSRAGFKSKPYHNYAFEISGNAIICRSQSSTRGFDLASKRAKFARASLSYRRRLTAFRRKRHGTCRSRKRPENSDDSMRHGGRINRSTSAKIFEKSSPCSGGIWQIIF